MLALSAGALMEMTSNALIRQHSGVSGVSRVESGSTGSCPVAKDPRQCFSPLNPELCCHARALKQEQEVRLRTISAPY
jgi:hypothetical protein